MKLSKHAVRDDKVKNMSDDIFDFDIDAALETAEEKAAEKASALPEILEDEADCEGCKI
ncbi:hypothetical protein [Rouxiella badensis]|uniref:hypothetical protein n=1 Tax=Rouxiella badensis TaxID=1646377 RepID=UPI0004B208C3|nr:hypothetical protein [Rouxiella badensis]MCC3701224.1 hypothetical protein [Rouxiella badensis]MCC3717651.1 hypothetical protein [Rouxiella badensis]MCC3727405.1 hypothetical protein [Rouxiella badensis]MCC3745914.1 hypothetical protein [Rouxiella badensis]QOI57919.1 hypothetical protein H2866_15110 [Rouxiella badensis subsp. acadiensis]